MSRRELQEAADGRGLRLVERSVTGLQSGEKSLDIAVLEGVADVPPSEYDRGADVGLVNYRADDGELPSGVYTLRLTAIDEIRERGPHPAIAEFVDEGGQTASRQRVELDVFSPEVPANRTFDQAVFSVGTRFREDMAREFTPHAIIIDFWCSNGLHGVIIVL